MYTNILNSNAKVILMLNTLDRPPLLANDLRLMWCWLRLAYLGALGGRHLSKRNEIAFLKSFI